MKFLEMKWMERATAYTAKESKTTPRSKAGRSETKKKAKDDATAVH